MSGNNGEHTYTLNRRFTATIAPGLAVQRVANVNNQPTVSLATDPTVAGGEDIEGLSGDAGGTVDKVGPVVQWGPAIMQLAEGVTVGTDAPLTCNGAGKGVLPKDGDLIVAVYEGAKDAGASATEARVFCVAKLRMRYASAGAQAYARQLKTELAAEAANVRALTITVTDNEGNPVAAARELLLQVFKADMTQDATAFRLAIGGTGSALSTDDKATLRVRTAASGIAIVNVKDIAGASGLTATVVATLVEDAAAGAADRCTPVTVDVAFDGV